MSLLPPYHMRNIETKPDAKPVMRKCPGYYIEQGIRFVQCQHKVHKGDESEKMRQAAELIRKEVGSCVEDS